MPQRQGSDLAGLRDALEAVPRSSPLHGRHSFALNGHTSAPAAARCFHHGARCEKAGSKTFVVLDTGIHHLGGMSGLGRIPRSAITLINLTAQREGEIVTDVVGPLCSPLDSLARGQKMPPVEVGDILAVPNVGAYGLTASLLGFLSHATPVRSAYAATMVVETWSFQCWHNPHRAV